MTFAQAKLSSYLPPLIFGTATFNYQFNVDPYALHSNEIVERALAQGVRAFDTSPYYGPAEEILGAALNTEAVQQLYHRDQYVILTKVGRIAADSFDYSPAWVHHSVQRSCQRLKTNYLDVVYCHDVEFVSPQEVLTAVRELRRIRDQEGLLKHVGICGYPVPVLCELAELILVETGEPIDIVQSYANFTVQNTRLLSQGLDRFVNAGVDVVTNASPLGMGLLRRQGVPVGAMGNWHPAPDELRHACAAVSRWVDLQGDKLEIVAVRFAIEEWARLGSKAGTYCSSSDTTTGASSLAAAPVRRLGVSVMGVSKIEELDDTMRVWRSVLDGLSFDDDADVGTMTPTETITDFERSAKRRNQITLLAKGIRQTLGRWADYAWASPDADFVNKGNADPVFTTKFMQPATTSSTLSQASGQLTPPPETS